MQIRKAWMVEIVWVQQVTSGSREKYRHRYCCLKINLHNYLSCYQQWICLELYFLCYLKHHQPNFCNKMPLKRKWAKLLAVCPRTKYKKRKQEICIVEHFSIAISKCFILSIPYYLSILSCNSHHWRFLLTYWSDNVCHSSNCTSVVSYLRKLKTNHNFNTHEHLKIDSIYWGSIFKCLHELKIMVLLKFPKVWSYQKTNYSKVISSYSSHAVCIWDLYSC